MIHTLHKTAAILALVLSIAFIAGPASAAEVPGTVNINSASAEQLTLLPRVGPSLATRILEYREANGNFSKTEDLIHVRGIGEKTFAGIEPFVTVKGETTLDRKLRQADVEAALGTAEKAPAGDAR